ncbi:MBL fold metallo-hydrolase [Sphaerospermopsis kisseleviana CS-549]|jgi:glyoxylase-like metal-dependent hydrolase (beta-lactamase superfamily II)/ferredoxin|uniref:Beta-lactamase domain-containing protein n=2 Tax=Sphaerospermopsis TaxID=752201 RepID=A0A480A9F7_9CYAN|nr:MULTISPECIES: MBL fold metallo-hydrolase [Sphaerospermopsis]MBD2133455.1 MBL fold metallo-hydrolase [Sphaerospermopsis sp. FACHB-1094]MDB9441033.1 MBL fold metallo-hydrolase [Sphaerospermopsis kisseleviana CS-549]BAZ82825.1 beta-lactamase domain-containing protein [Sphaerospermopsis kisseleviana NIES-73]GCL38764.1 beta-lactamase domain-containing protein [Sphaerospermopsis reniformis]
MANLNQRRPENINGDFYVDTTCIDCDTCRWMTPEVFSRIGEQSAVHHQPSNNAERIAALQALLSCPTSSIGTVETPQDINFVQQTFPILIDENIYHCGYHSEKSFASVPYLIQHPEGNILVDSPRFAPPLVKRLEEMGGIKYLFLSHKDDLADHQQFADYFQCQRILHSDDIDPETKNIEIQITGSEPFQLTADLLIIPVPGHTKGHTVLLYKNKFLFTGDHLTWSQEEKQLIAFREFCWYSWTEQIQSMRKLTNYTFEWVLPSHGRRYQADSEIMQQKMQRCIDFMESLQ